MDHVGFLAFFFFSWCRQSDGFIFPQTHLLHIDFNLLPVCPAIMRDTATILNSLIPHRFFNIVLGNPTVLESKKMQIFQIYYRHIQPDTDSKPLKKVKTKPHWILIGTAFSFLFFKGLACCWSFFFFFYQATQALPLCYLFYRVQCSNVNCRTRRAKPRGRVSENKQG